MNEKMLRHALLCGALRMCDALHRQACSVLCCVLLCVAVPYCCLRRGKCAALFVNADKALARAPDGQEQWAKNSSANNNNCARARVLQLSRTASLASSLPDRPNCFVDIAIFNFFYVMLLR